MLAFSKIGLLGRLANPGVADTVRLLIDELSRRDGVELTIDESLASLVEDGSLRVARREQLGHYCDLVIVVGGDGSLLKVAPTLADQDLPVVGINRGTLGFLTDILPEEIESHIGAVLGGRFQIESRFLLDIHAQHEGDQLSLGSALNDVVLHPGIAAQMIEFELYIDGEFVYNQASDGLIVATPTGSTAYSMSAGGPIMHPTLNAVVLVPMYPHSLSSRPIVINADSEITLVVGNRHSIMPQVSCDGSVVLTTSPGDLITIRKKSRRLRLVHPADYNYYETCRSKLGWSSRLGRPQRTLDQDSLDQGNRNQDN